MEELLLPLRIAHLSEVEAAVLAAPCDDLVGVQAVVLEVERALRFAVRVLEGRGVDAHSAAHARRTDKSVV